MLGQASGCDVMSFIADERLDDTESEGGLLREVHAMVHFVAMAAVLI